MFKSFVSQNCQQGSPPRSRLKVEGERALLLFIVFFSLVIKIFYDKHLLPCDYQHKNELVCFSKCKYDILNEKMIRKKTMKQKERETGEERKKDGGKN